MKRLFLLTLCVFLATALWIHRAGADNEQRKLETASLSLVVPSPTPTNLPSSVELPGATWVPQTYNNCGPAATSMLLQYFGYSVDQNETKRNLRTGDSDVNVTLPEIASYIKTSYDLDSKIFVNGDILTVKSLIADGFYVMVEDWLHPNEDIGHVLILRGYDDNKGVLIGDDSFIGVGVTYPYAEFEQTQWKPFNRGYMPVYKGDRQSKLGEIVGADWEPTSMYKRAIETARSEIAANPNDMYAYFNLGTSYFGLKDYTKAYLAFETSKGLGWPKRMLWYQTQPIETSRALGIAYPVQ